MPVPGRRGLVSDYDYGGSMTMPGGLASFSSHSVSWLTLPPIVEGVTLRVYPYYCQGNLLRPKVGDIFVDSNGSLSNNVMSHGIFPENLFSY